MAFIPDKAVFDCAEVSPSAFKLYAYYCMRRNKETGTCWTKARKIASETGINYSFLSELKTELVKAGWIETTEDGHISPLKGFGYSKTISDIPIGNPKQVSEIPKTISDIPKSPYIEPVKEPLRTKKVGAHAPPPDPRCQHPAIQAVKALMSRWPEKVLWDEVIETVGQEPDMQKLSACRRAWVKAGFNPNSTAWALEWYANGIPERIQSNGASNGNRFAPRPDRSETNVARWRAIAADPDFGFAEDPTGSPPGVDEPANRGDGFPDAPRAVA